MLTPKQEKFCKLYIETGNASEAYRAAYKADKMKPETVNRNAFALLQNSKIAARLDELRAELAKRHALTVDALIVELEEARKIGKETLNPSAMIAATMGKAKLLGFDKPSQQDDEEAPKPVKVEVIVSDARKPNSNHSAIAERSTGDIS